MKLVDLVHAVFPGGSPQWRVFAAEQLDQKSPAMTADERPTWDVLPGDPVDVFALASFALSRSGAYHHVQPETDPPHVDTVRRILVTPQDRSDWRRIGAAWAAAAANGLDPKGLYLTLDAPTEVKEAWAIFVAAFDEPVFHPMARNDPPPAWWRAALVLMATADEACHNVGFTTGEELAGRDLSLIALAAELRIRAAVETRDAEQRGAYTLSAADPEMACVLPKSRTPALGCTVRSLSNNLALLPPRGLVRARWIAPGGEQMRRDGDSPLNLLLVPFPFATPAKAFQSKGHSAADAATPWGWFGVSPPGKDKTGQTAAICDFTEALIEEASKDVGDIHGVVFPELALSGAQFDELLKRLSKRDCMEFVASGLYTDQNGEEGNFAAAAILPPGGGKRRFLVQDVRQKHHRWRLDEAQIASYALGSALDPERAWWEKLDVLSRSLTIGVLRGETTVTTLICEDLARVDPVQELLRAIGPNIVIAILMDSAQLQTRWPSRYATVLAEDPGSSVLTFTSLGLIERVNATGQYPPSRCIALWRDDRSVKELKLPSDAHALCVTLTPIRIEESTLDGRSDSKNALTWRLGGAQPVKAPKGAQIPEWG